MRKTRVRRWVGLAGVAALIGLLLVALAAGTALACGPSGRTPQGGWNQGGVAQGPTYSPGPGGGLYNGGIDPWCPAWGYGQDPMSGNGYGDWGSYRGWGMHDGYQGRGMYDSYQGWGMYNGYQDYDCEYGYGYGAWGQ